LRQEDRSDDCPRCGWILKPTKRGYLECKMCGWRRPLKVRRRTLRQYEFDDFEMRGVCVDYMLAYRNMSWDGRHRDNF
jgi:DNA-directed RNA polymerase subunit RPC12/RpoP